MENVHLPTTSDSKADSLFEFASCSSFLITVKNSNGALCYIKSKDGNYTPKSPAQHAHFEQEFLSSGYDSVSEKYNTYLGWLDKEDVIVSNTPSFENTLTGLKNLAMEEEWGYINTTTDKPLPILHNYLKHTFARLKDENKIITLENYASFNTGLVTKNQEEIFMIFRKHKVSKKWVFQEFAKESSYSMNKFNPLPERAVYFTDPSEVIYDARLSLRINIDHIIDDEENFNRFPTSIKMLPKHQLVNTFQGALIHAEKRIKRNYLTAIPQFYRGYVNGHLQLLLPLCLTNPAKADLALAVYKDGSTYNGRTCLTLDMAINNARLITKPDDEWLKA